MAKPIVISKGATYTHVLRWESSIARAYAPITGVTQAGPVVITSPGHGIPDGWRLDRITGIKGTTQLNTHRLVNGVHSRTAMGRRYPDGFIATVLTSNTIAISAVNSSDFGAYVSGGMIEYDPPVNLTGYTARLQVRASVESSDILLELTDTSGIAINNAAKTITLNITATATAALTFASGVTSLEMTDSSGVVSFLIRNAPVIVQETDVTR